MERDDSGTFVLGAAILAIGAALLVDRLGIFPWTAQWSVWPLLLIAYGVVHLAHSPWAGAKGVFPIALGVWIWAAQAGWIAWRESWPLVFVFLGVAVMWQAWGAPADQTPLVATRRPASPLIGLAVVATILAATSIDASHFARPNRGIISSTTDTADRMHLSVVMGQAHRAASPQAVFHGGDSYTFMGETDIDLRNAVNDGQPIAIDIFAMMGQVVVFVPDGWGVDNQITPFMGQVEDRRGMPESARVRGRVNRRTIDGNGDTWSDQGQAGPTGQAGPAGPAGQAAPAAAANPGRIVLTGSVTMGDVLIR